MEEWLLISELAGQSCVPENTVRRYCKLFDKYLESKQTPKGKRYHPDSVQVLGNIFAWYRDKLTSSEIEDKLSQTGRITYEAGALPAALNNEIEVMKQLAESLRLVAGQQERLNRQDGIIDEQVRNYRNFHAEESIRANEQTLEIKLLREQIEELQARMNRPWWKKVF